MGFISCMSPCVGCGQVFSYNPDRVPSIRVNAERQPDPNGNREPICQNCVERFNGIRRERGLEPIVPLPGAYDPIPEEQW